MKVRMSFWYMDHFALDSGKSMWVDYWFSGGADNGAQMATPVPYLSAADGLLATGQGVRYDYDSRKFIYRVTLTNTGPEAVAFQIRGGGFT
jgi:hypothetical protein